MLTPQAPLFVNVVTMLTSAQALIKATFRYTKEKYDDGAQHSAAEFLQNFVPSLFHFDEYVKSLISSELTEMSVCFRNVETGEISEQQKIIGKEAEFVLSLIPPLLFELESISLSQMFYQSICDYNPHGGKCKTCRNVPGTIFFQSFIEFMFLKPFSDRHSPCRGRTFFETIPKVLIPEMQTIVMGSAAKKLPVAFVLKHHILP